MSASNTEGKAQPVPTYSLQSDMPFTYNSIPHSMVVTTNLNPHAEGLEESLIADESEDKEGLEADRLNQILLGNPHVKHSDCCRRYSCCFPLIIVILVWLMMVSADSFEHCPNCVSSNPKYSCELQALANYYCKADKLQVCCDFVDNKCRDMDYPQELHYLLGKHFKLSMYVVIIICMIPLLAPCGVPFMLFKDCKHEASSSVCHQRVFDILCIICFVASSVLCSWTVIKYYEFPRNRCSSNSKLFGISSGERNTALVYSYSYSNVWIMSQTTYSSFFGFMMLCSFTILGSILLVLQLTANRAKKEDVVQNEE